MLDPNDPLPCWRPSGVALELLCDRGPIGLVRALPLSETTEDSPTQNPTMELNIPVRVLKSTSSVAVNIWSLRVKAYLMRKETATLRAEFEMAELRVARLLQEAQELRQTLQDMRFLDDLILLLEGQLENIPHRRWPFTLAQSAHESQEINLII